MPFVQSINSKSNSVASAASIVGQAVRFYIKSLNNALYSYVITSNGNDKENARNQPTTLIVGAIPGMNLVQIRSTIQNALLVAYTAANVDCGMLPGAGAPEIVAASELRQRALNSNNKIYKVFAESLEAIPIALGTNCGHTKSDIYPLIRQVQ